MTTLRPLHPNTAAQYARILRRAQLSEITGLIEADLSAWTPGCRGLLRAALKRRAREQGVDPASLLAMVPAEPFRVRRAIVIMNEADATKYEEAARKLPPGRAALALLPLATGLRAEEVTQLTRAAVKHAERSADLLVLRKGGKEQVLHLPNAVKLFTALLALPRAVGKSLEEPSGVWETLGQTLSPASHETQYHLLHRLVRAVGVAAGVPQARPHLLRHAFATRMARDGADITVIQMMLNHSKIETTTRYLHLDTSDAAKYLREF